MRCNRAVINVYGHHQDRVTITAIENGLIDVASGESITSSQIARDRDARTIRLSQRLYIKDIVRRYGCHNERTLSLPMGTNVKLSTSQSPKTPEDVASMRNIPYREAVGSLCMLHSGLARISLLLLLGFPNSFENPGSASLGSCAQCLCVILMARAATGLFSEKMRVI